MDGFQRHFDSQIISYGKQMIVNLVCFHFFLPEKAAVLLSRLLSNTVSGFFNIFFYSVSQVNQKGSEKPLEQTFAKMVNSMANGMVRYV